jgi:transcriptional regulator with XRE-family HTH domain
MSELKAFAGLHQALAHLCLRDGRARRDIAEAAGINASMLSGYCSGRLAPSLENLDRLLTSLGVKLEDLASELRMVNQPRPATPAPLLDSPEPKDELAAVRRLALLINDAYDLIQRGYAAAPEPQPPSSPADAAPPRKGGRRRGPKTGG